MSDFITKGAISASALQAYAAAALKSDPIRIDWRNRSDWRELNPSKLRIPTLVIHGAFDPEATGSGNSIFLDLGTNDRQWVIVPDADHGLHIEKSRIFFINAIINFIELPRTLVVQQ